MTCIAVQFEGALGRLTASSVHNPRKIIDVTSKEISETEDSKAKEIRRYKELLFDIEAVSIFVLRLAYFMTLLIWSRFGWAKNRFILSPVVKREVLFQTFFVYLQGFDLLLDIDDIEKKVLALPEESRWVVGNFNMYTSIHCTPKCNDAHRT